MNQDVTEAIDSAYLLRIFHQINTHLTFLSSHSRSTIPTYDLLHKLNSSISVLDLTIISYILPNGDVTFQYVDETQVLTSLKEKVEFNWNTGYKQSRNETVDDMYEEIATNQADHSSKQLLIFDFKDVRTHGIQAAMAPRRKKQKQDTQVQHSTGFFLSSKELALQNLTHKQLLGIIISRDKKFKTCLDEFMAGHSDVKAGERQLVATCRKLIPEPEVLEDPMADFMSNSIPDGEKPTVEEMVAVLRKKPFYRDQIIHETMLTTTREPVLDGLGVRKVKEETDDASSPIQIHPDLIEALQRYKNICINDGLYSHQAEAIRAVLGQSNNHVIVSTSTSSGKSFIYQIPILNQILWDISNYKSGSRRSTAFFIFPTKALAQDQKRHLQELINHLETNKRRKIIIDTYDGDTPSSSRQYIRKYADIIFTNPDAIHASILPNHNRVHDSGWTEFLTALKYVVIDEIHIYKGTFGVHMSYVMRRLNRLAHLLKQEDILNHTEDSAIQYISCSATILNPTGHFRVICGLSENNDNIIHVSKDGSPCGNKDFIIWSPPPLMNKLGQTKKKDSPINEQFIPRENIVPELAKLLIHLLVHFPAIKVILFCPIRKICELIMREVRMLMKEAGNKAGGVSEHDIMSYRGGYSKNDRRIIEERMFDGRLRAIVATNALELGIDLSELDVVITCGFPQLKLNMHQQFGRAGRTAKSNSLAIYVCGSTPTDEHYKKHPSELSDTNSYEDLCVEGLIDLDLKLLIMEMHLQCAAFEYPVDMTRDIDWFVTDTRNTSQCNRFVNACINKLYKDGKGSYRTHPNFLPWPADHVSIRAVEETSYAVVDITNGNNTIIEEVESLRTSFELYEGGIFLHQGLPYLVKEFNTKDHYAKVERVNVEWITQQRDFTDVDAVEIEYIKCLNSSESDNAGDIPVFYGKIEITTIVFGFFKVNRRAEILEAVEVDNPPMKMYSKGFWLDIPSKAIQLIREKGLNVSAGIHAAQHAIMNILPIFINGGATTNPNVRFNSNLGEAELKTECKAPKKEFAQRQSARMRPPRLVFHDAKGGKQGTGVSAKTFEHIDEILYTTYVRVRDCECEWGCPLCVAAGFCKEMMLVMSKPAAEIILGTFIGIELDVLDNQVCNGPEPNLPEINIDTISDPISVRISPNVEIIELVPRAVKINSTVPSDNGQEQDVIKDEEPMKVEDIKGNTVVKLNSLGEVKFEGK